MSNKPGTKNERPDFMEKGVFSWNARGYRFSATPSMTLMSPSALDHDNPWIVLAGVLERAKGGDFESLPLLTRCVRESDHPVLWRASFELLGDAGSMPLVKNVLHRFSAEILENGEALFQRHLAYTLAQSLYLWIVPLMLDIYLRSTDRQETGIITVLLSRLLEEELGPIGAAAGPDDEYRELVTNRYDTLREELGGDSSPVLYGKPFSVGALTAHLSKTLRAARPDRVSVQTDRHLFEAATGLDCSRFFENGELKAPRAIAVVEDFLMSGGLAPFQDGTRYFFGHEILA
jgi:hypothetical protein